MTARLDQQSAAAKTVAEKLERLLERYPSSLAQAPEGRESRESGILALREKIAAARAPGQPLAREALSRPVPAPDRGLSLRREDRAPRPSRSDDDELFEIIEPALRMARGSGR